MEQRPFNPWLAIWVEPRKTARYFIEHKSMAYVHYLAIFVGFFYFLDKAVEKSTGDHLATIFIVLLAIFLSPIIGFIQLYVSSALSLWIGKWFNGVGSFNDLLKAYGASYLPTILIGGLWVFHLAFGWNTVFTSDSYTIIQAFWFIISGLIELAFGIWAFIISIFTIAEAHQFSAWKALITVLLPAIILFVFLIFIVLVFSM